MSDLAPLLNFARWSAIAAGVGVGLPVTWRAALSVYDNLYERIRQARHDALTLQHIKKQNELHAVRVLSPDDNGRQGIVFDGQVYHNMDSGEVFTQITTRYLDPMRLQLDGIQRTLLAMRGVTAGNAGKVGDLAENVTPVHWPGQVIMGDLFRDRRPSIHDLVIGVRPGDNGQLEIISDSLHNLMHVLSVGASGWGKSTWLRSFLWQIAKAPESCEVIAVDINGSEFNILREWGKLRYPVARTKENAAAVLEAVIQEIQARSKLYEDHPLVTNLTEYNKATGADLPPLVVAVDEGTNLLHKSGIGDPLREMVQTARQYGVYVLLAGQSAKHSVIDTETRDQFSTRLCFHTSPPSSRVVLDDKAAADLRVKGRAIVQMDGHERTEIQGLWVTREQFMQVLTGKGARLKTPQPDPRPEMPGGLTNEQIDQVMDLHYAGEKPTPIADQVLGYANARTIGIVKSVIAEYDDNDDSDNGDDNGPI